MTTSTIGEQINNAYETSREAYILRPIEYEGISDWQEADVLNREIRVLLDKLPSEQKIDSFISTLRTDELRYVVNRLLKGVVSAAKTEDLYPLTYLYLLNSFFSKTEDVVARDVKSKSKVFKKLAESWHKDTDHHSFSYLITSHEAYLKIIGMGTTAIPFILRDLKERGGNWYVALRALSGQDPVPLESKGNVPLMKKSWLRWGCDNGYIE